MIQTGLRNLAGGDGEGYFSVVPGLNIDSLGIPSSGGSTSRSSKGGGNAPSSVKDSNATSFPSKPSNLPDWVPASKISPYFREVRLSSLRAGSSRSQGHVTLKSSSNREEKINITGWQIKAKNGGTFVPKAVEFYMPTGLSSEVDIRLAKNDQVTIYTTMSPIGQNLRLNKCIGYIDQETKFSPALPNQCPRPDDDDVRQYSAQCIDYVGSIRSCEVPKSDPPLPYYDYQCREYLKQFTYQGCYGNHYSDPDFLSSQWRAWSGSVFLNPKHDRILLLDRSGLVVDYREY